MFVNRTDQQVIAIALMIAAIIFLNYYTLYVLNYEHSLYRMVIYLPLVLGTLWFALKGAVTISVSTILFHIPYGVQHWNGFHIDNIHVLCEALVYVMVALILGFHVQRIKKEREDLIETERLSAIGRTVVEVAHDMRSPLVAIGGFTEQIFRKLDQTDPNKKKLAIVLKETAHIERMVREMLDFGKSIKLELNETSLNEVVTESVALAQPEAAVQGVELITNLASRLPRRLLDAHRLKQVILNLVTNAIQASSKGDHVKVSTYSTDLGDIALDVADTGCGIKRKDLENIFMPFFTTKRNGTGLGLPISKKIVEAHGGDLHLFPNKEMGVTFRVQIPALSTEAYKKSDKGIST